MEEVMIKHYGRKYKKKEKYQDKANARMGRHVERRKRAQKQMDLEDSELSVENVVLMEENEEGKQVPTVIINKETDVVTLTRTSLDKPREGTSRSQSRRNSIDMIRRNSLDAPSRVSMEGPRRSSIDNNGISNRRRSIEIGPNQRNSRDGIGGRSRANSISERSRPSLPPPPVVTAAEEYHSDHEHESPGGGIMFASAEHYTTGQYYDVQHQHLHYHHHHHHYHFPRQPHHHGRHHHKRHQKQLEYEGDTTGDDKVSGKQKKDKKGKKNDKKKKNNSE
eukprot:TRINITY_DN8818_c0_g1_i1.p1 TRINITY_DN8818_c0_g1~~TRINITY_DN8818_c0_g1_i1.p1  ORF type:complete len:323 (-),score=69.91 TRINITY_DN8818_c0_g1_i1:34-867(-)